MWEATKRSFCLGSSLPLIASIHGYVVILFLRQPLTKYHQLVQLLCGAQSYRIRSCMLAFVINGSETQPNAQMSSIQCKEKICA